MAQLSLLAKLSALLGGFQVAMYINQGMPGLDEAWDTVASVDPSDRAAAGKGSRGGVESNSTVETGRGNVWSSNPQLNDGILTLWAMTCVLVIVLNLCVMIMSALLQLYVVRRTHREPDFQNNDSVRYTEDPQNGVIATQEDFSQFWDRSCDRKYTRLLRAFSWGIPLYFLSLALAAVIKFYMSPWAAWYLKRAPKQPNEPYTIVLRNLWTQRKNPNARDVCKSPINNTCASALLRRPPAKVYLSRCMN